MVQRVRFTVSECLHRRLVIFCTLHYQTISLEDGGRQYICDYQANYIFTDTSGARHALGLLRYVKNYTSCASHFSVLQVLSAQEGPYQATLDATSGLVTIAGPDGTVFSGTGDLGLVDRNGNEGGAGGDDLGRTTASVTYSNNFPSSVTVTGIPNPYTVTPTTATSNFTVGYTVENPDSGFGCGPAIPTDSEGQTTISSITLPNGEKYQFQYDSTYGLLNKVIYPSGGYVSYTWGLNSRSDWFTEIVQSNYACQYQYDFPAVTHRYVSFDGVNVALQQDFSYSTNWGGNPSWYWQSKQTTITTHDLTRPGQPSYQTVYTYVPVSAPELPPNYNFAGEIPVESSIVYYGTNGTILRTVNKVWNDQYRLGAECTTLDTGTTSGLFYTYGASYGYGIGSQITDKKEFDYGQVTSGTCQQPSSTPARETLTNYESFSATPIFPSAPSIFDRPCSVVTKDSSGNKAAETDYLYDGGTSVCGTPGTGSVANANGPYDHSSAYAYTVSPQPPRGNATSMTLLCLQAAPACASGNPTTNFTYDETGQTISAKDPNGNTTQYSYADSYTSGTPPGNTNAYLTKITYPTTNGVPHIENFSYGYADGQLTKSTDQNSQITTFTYNTPPSGCSYPDGLDRLSETDYANGGKTTRCYNDATYSSSAPSPSVSTAKTMNSTQSVASLVAMDGMGHATQTRLTSDPQGTSIAPSTYDGLGRVYQQYNPTRCSPPTANCGESTWGITTYVYDALGRTTSVTKPDSSVVTTAYCGQDTLVTDEAGHWRRSVRDALGRLIEVDEPNSTTATVSSNGCPGQNDPIWKTTYTYDALDDLTAVVQGGSHNRSFTYNSLRQLTQSTNPETGTTCYGTVSGTTCQQNGYDANGNVIHKTDARLITTTTTFDALNRMTAKTYTNNDPSVAYTYDRAACLGQSSCYNIDRRTSMTDAGGTENLAYDKMGRELVEQRTTNSIPKSTTYTYDLAGNLATLTYPSGRTITYTYDSAGRPSDAVDTANSINYVVGSCSNGAASPTTGACYAPQGAVYQLQNGTNLVSTYLYNTRLQPCWMYATTGTALPTSTLCTATDPGPGNILDLQYNFNSGHDNGNVIGITNNRSGQTGRTQSFTYDQVNRIVSGQSSATTGSTCWGETYTLDQWANLSAIGAVSGYTGCTQDNLSVSINANNQLSSGFTYDSAGNLTFAGPSSYTYNAESELVQSSVSTEAGYVYDGDGSRLEKTNGVQPTKIYWYGAGTEILDESDPSGNFTNEYVFFGGKRVAMRNVSTGTIYYYEEDMLGSSRTMVQAGQTSVCFDADFLPFGYEKDVTTTCTQNYKFEGKERDTETNNDDFGARYYSSQYGRWLSADWSSVPAPVPYANLTNPQTLNLYAMVSDNPESFADLDGHQGAEEEEDENPEEEAKEQEELAKALATVEANQQLAVANSPGALALRQSGYTDPVTGFCYAPQNTLPTMGPQENAPQENNPPNPYGSKGAPDHQQTRDDLAEENGARKEVRVDTPNGTKQSRVIDVAKLDENGNVKEAWQVIRPNKSGTPPAREVRAAKDIEGATGVKPQMVPVRPLPPKPSQNEDD